MSKRLSFNDIKGALAGAQVHKAKSKAETIGKAISAVKDGVKKHHDETLKSAASTISPTKGIGSFNHTMPKAPTSFKPMGDLTPPGSLHRPEVKK